MLFENCAECGSKVPIGELLLFNGRSYCGDCIPKAQAGSGNGSSTPVQRVDPTICGGCGRHASGELYEERDGEFYCNDCAARFAAVGFPQWLKGSLAVLSFLLILSVYHGWHFILAVRNTYRAERAIAQHQPDKAAILLRPVVDRAPGCEKCTLLLAIAWLRLGDARESYRVLNLHNGGKYSNDEKELLDEIQASYNRVDKAGASLDQVEKLLHAEQIEDARAKLAEARRIYPEWNVYPAVEREIAIGTAFHDHDWDKFLQMEQEALAEDPDSPMQLTATASALAAKYAATGDDTFRAQAEQMLATAQEKTKGNKELEGQVRTYSERVKYRLRTRRIISSSEYERLFPSEAKTEVAK